VNRPARIESGSEKDKIDALSPVDALSTLLADDLKGVEALILERMQSPVGMIPDIASHLIEAGGKRLRPLITLAAAKACGGGGSAALALATAVEFIHTATLLHDDVVDGSTLRRGKTAANLVWGNQSSVLVGDFLFARSFNLMVEAGSIDILDVLARASSTIAEGEVMQLAAAAKGEASRSGYDAIIEAKTAALFSAAAKVGAMSAGASKAEVDAMADYGRHLGLAFQLVDDALDYGGVTEALGKNIGDDFREGKATLPLIIALESAASEERNFWEQVLSKRHEPHDLARGLELIKRHRGVVLTLEAAQEHADSARGALSVMTSSPFVDALADLADYVVQRAN
jgi:octaprenyl-diphosphate synthase